MLRKHVLQIITAFILTFLWTGCSTVQQTTYEKSVKSKNKTGLSTSEIQNLISKATVKITLTEKLPIYKTSEYEAGDPIAGTRRFDEGIVKEIGSGIGFITENNFILTNNHVVDVSGADYTIQVSNGTEYPSRILAKDSQNDIAVLKITEQVVDLPSIKLSESDDYKIGINVVTANESGILIDTGKHISTDTIYLTDLLQTNIPTSSGDSGSPLVDINGEAIGINSAFSTKSDNEGYAIPIYKAKALLEEAE